MALAADRLRTLSGKRRIVIITDGALTRDGPLGTGGLDAQVVVVGDDEDNAAIVRVDVRTGTDPVTRRDQAQVDRGDGALRLRCHEAEAALAPRQWNKRPRPAEHGPRPAGHD